MKFASCSLLLIAMISCLLAHYTIASPITAQRYAKYEKKSVPSSASSSPPPIRIRKGLPFKNNEIGIVGFQGSSSKDTDNKLNKNS